MYIQPFFKNIYVMLYDRDFVLNNIVEYVDVKSDLDFPFYTHS